MSRDDLPDHLQDKVDELARDRYPDLYDDDSKAWSSAIELGAPEPAVDPLQAVKGESDAARAERLQRAVDVLRDRVDEMSTSLAGRAPLLSVERDQHGTGCGYPHPQVIVSLTTSSVRCGACGAELEAMDVLRQYAQGERRFVQGIDSLRKQRLQLYNEVEQLKQIRTSLRSQVRAKGGRAPG